ncbi:pentapeptide repeat-containing protein [Streptomyces luteogriseus]|uniref:pentapeptide repeat-containing protein n=1 Tax=Streptomyces luteogriseus TaxID=68233 RepID=UPI003792CCFE
MVEPHSLCLAHLEEADRTAYLDGLTAGADVDHRGTEFEDRLLSQLLDAVRDPASGRPHFGDASFSLATFSGKATFDRVMFSGRARFRQATFSAEAGFFEAAFSNEAGFFGVTFSAGASFGGAIFTGTACFDGTTFTFSARFVDATFSGIATFREAKFSAKAEFAGATFCRDTKFHGATFSDAVEFRKATFETAAYIGPLICHGLLDLYEAHFAGPTTIEAATAQLRCQRSRWASTAHLRLRYATVDLTDANFEYPMSVAARPSPLQFHALSANEDGFAGQNPRVRVASVSGVDAAHLVLTDIDLSECQFTGAVHLDQLRLEGRCSFNPTPPGVIWRGLLPTRCSPRRTLVEEHHWRASVGQAGWTPTPARTEVVGPTTLAPVYRQLRKSLEDGKNEPDAADFYYGELEMRRHDHERPLSERALLTVYWALSGYGLRASRALGCLLAAMAVTVLTMMLWGLARDDPKPVSTGTVDGRRITMTTDVPDPVNPDGPYGDRLSAERFEKSLRVVINSVIFRSSGQDLTTAGTYIEMTSRLAEPVLAGLAALAVRSRVKR